MLILKDMEEARARRKERLEQLKLLDAVPAQRKPTFPQVAALLEEVKLIHMSKKRERNHSEASVSSSDSN